MSARLRLRRAMVVSADPLAVEIDGERRPAWADTALLGQMHEGDEVIVNVAALDLGLGSGGFDIVHVNLTRGLDAAPGGDEHVIKLNYSSLQHPVAPVELPLRDMYPGGTQIAAQERGGGTPPPMPVLVLPLHGHLAPAAWAAAEASPDLRVGYVQSGGGALPGGLGRDVPVLRERGLLCAHVTASPAYGGEREALSVAGALDAGRALGWGAAIVGPGPGIIGSETALGHGGMAALDNAHAALALGLPTAISPRLSEGDPRERHRGVSHHTLTVLSMLLAPVDVPVPAGNPELTREIDAAPNARAVEVSPAAPEDYPGSGLPTRTMGRGIEEDELFFAAALAAGAHLGALAAAPA